MRKAYSIVAISVPCHQIDTKLHVECVHFLMGPYSIHKTFLNCSEICVVWIITGWVGKRGEGGGCLLSIGISESADTSMPSGATMRFPGIVAWDGCFTGFALHCNPLHSSIVLQYIALLFNTTHGKHYFAIPCVHFNVKHLFTILCIYSKVWLTPLSSAPLTITRHTIDKLLTTQTLIQYKYRN